MSGADAESVRTDAVRVTRGRFRFPTAILLTCAALGVAGAVLLAPMNWASTILTGPLPFLGMALAGLWLLPSVIALRLLRRPLVGLLVGLISGLVLVPFSGHGFRSVGPSRGGGRAGVFVALRSSGRGGGWCGPVRNEGGRPAAHRIRKARKIAGGARQRDAEQAGSSPPRQANRKNTFDRDRPLARAVRT